jgi:hypothetical protein
MCFLSRNRFLSAEEKRSKFLLLAIEILKIILIFFCGVTFFFFFIGNTRLPLASDDVFLGLISLNHRELF